MSLEIINFKSEYAQKYGMLEAVILWQIHYFLTHAKANKEKYYDCKYWTFNSVRAWQELLPFATYKQIKTALSKLRKLGILIVGKFNKKKYDKTLWYSLNDDFFNHSLSPTGPKDCPCRANGKALKGQPIPKESSKELSKEVVEESSDTTSTTTNFSNSLKEFKDYFNSIPFYSRLKAPGAIVLCHAYYQTINNLTNAYNELLVKYIKKKPYDDKNEEAWQKDCHSYIENAILKEIKK